MVKDSVNKLKELEKLEGLGEVKVPDAEEFVEKPEKKIVKASVADPEAELVFDSTQAELWLTKASYRKQHTVKNALIKEGAIPDKHLVWLFSMVVRSVRHGGTLYAPKKFPEELLDTFKEVKGKSTSKYLALLIP